MVTESQGNMTCNGMAAMTGGESVGSGVYLIKMKAGPVSSGEKNGESAIAKER